MTTVDRLWYLADRADQRAEQAYHRIREAYGDPALERTHRKRVSRERFRTLAERIRNTGTPYGAHTLVRNASGEVLLVRHRGVDLWVLPGGEVGPEETVREAAERELAEEAGLEASYGGLVMLNRVEIRADANRTWGVLPVFDAQARTTAPRVDDPDGEITRARWFPPGGIPEDTRDRRDVVDAARELA